MASWLTGYWQGEGLGGKIEEVWSEAQGSSMMGMQMSATGRDCLAGSKMPRPLRHDGKRWLCDTQLRG